MSAALDLVPESNMDWAGLTAQQVMDNWSDDLWRNALTMALGQFVENMIYYHRAEIQTMINDAADKHIEKSRRAVMKAYLKSNVIEVAKTAMFEDQHPRGKGGKFRSKYEQMRDQASERRSETVPGSYLGYDEPSYNLGDQARNQARAATMAAQMVNDYSSRVKNGRKAEGVTFRITDANGKIREATTWDGRVPNMSRSERVYQIRSNPYGNPHTVGESAYNVAWALGASSSNAGSAGAMAQGLHDSVNQQSWGKRLIAASDALFHATGSGAGPIEVQTATALAKAVGQHGPEAAKVLGPHMRRLAYKYQGQVASPREIKEVMGDTPLRPFTSDQGVTEPVTAYESKLAQVLAPRIPSDAQINLLLKTGSTPPSTGFLLDKYGRVTQLAIGHHDDHYVPFNLRQLHSLQGGSYVRNRAYGGPTTEDMATALAGGADRFTVVSKNGFYRVTMKPGLGRFGATQRLMTDRYGKLLDAVKNGSLPDPDAQVGEGHARPILTLNGHGYDVALRALKTQFPFAIQEVEYIPASQLKDFGLKGKVAGAAETDPGYVRPYFLKPSEAKQGYYDSKIGQPKRSFDEVDGYRFGVARRAQAKQTEDRWRERQDSWQNTGRSATEGGVTLHNVPWEVARNVEAGGGVSQAPKKSDTITPDEAADFTSWVESAIEHATDNLPESELHEEGHSELLSLYENWMNPIDDELNQDYERALMHDTPLPGFLATDPETGPGLRTWLLDEVTALGNTLKTKGLDNIRVNKNTGDIIETGRPFPDPPELASLQGRDREIKAVDHTGTAAIPSLEQLKRDPDFQKLTDWRRAAQHGQLNDKKMAKLMVMEEALRRAEAADIAGRTEQPARVTSLLEPLERQESAAGAAARQAAEYKSMVADVKSEREVRDKSGPVIRVHPQAAAELSADPDFSIAVGLMQSPNPNIPPARKDHAAQVLEGAVGKVVRNYSLSEDEAQETVAHAMRMVRDRYKKTNQWRP